ncbi:MAG: hypothetical protein JNM58_05745 [Xanthomonadaceae bacterium]|nr:hypothetical protein [Xanthomonadaceae bacterium]
MSGAPTPSGAGIEATTDPNPGVLWPVGARLVSATRSMLWLAPLLGGLMLLVHFWRVGYLPALSFSELGVVLGAFGLFVAMGLGAALVLILFPIFLIWLWMTAGLIPAPPPVQLPIQKRRRRSLSRQPLPLADAQMGSGRRRFFSRTFSRSSLLIFCLGSVSAVGLTATGLFLTMQLAEPWQSVPIVVLMGGSGLVGLLLVLWSDFGFHAKALRFIRHWAMQFLLLLILYLLLWHAWFALVARFDAAPESTIGQIFLGVFVLLLVPFAHWVWYASMRATGPGVIKVRVVILVMMLAYTGLTPSLLDGAASTYGFGMMRKVDLVLSARGCAIVKEALPGQACEPSPAKGDDDRRVYRLRGVDVLTRIGASYVIAPAGGIDDRKLPRLALPAGEVHALVRSMEDKVESH